MTKFQDLKAEAKKLGIRVPFGTSAEKLEELIENTKEPKLEIKTKAPKIDDPEDEGDKLTPPETGNENINIRPASSYHSNPPANTSPNDYLWPFEIDKNTGYPHFKARTVPFDPPWQYRQPDRSDAVTTKKRLLAEPTVLYIVPMAEGEKGDVYQSVGINGYRLDLPKNEAMQLPKSVVELLMNSFKQTQKAINTGLYENAKGMRVS